MQDGPRRNLGDVLPSNAGGQGRVRAVSIHRVYTFASAKSKHPSQILAWFNLAKP